MTATGDKPPVTLELTKQFRFEAAHRLPNVPPGHKCGRLHGHSYQVDVHIVGQLDETKGWVVDFGDISEIVKPILGELDHRCLNDIPGLENPTSELLACWLWRRIRREMGSLAAITVRETETASCVFRGPAAEREAETL
jgi:6-pyruvoyltetrahydropterin/6-carboxytetrahydropterin synthase